MSLTHPLHAIASKQSRRAARVACLSVAAALCAPATDAADRDGFRPYFTLKAGGAYYSDPDKFSDLKLENPSQWPFPFFALGANFNRYVGAELAVEYTETNLLTSGLTSPGSENQFGEYSSWTIMPTLRLRYPLFKDRFVPYLTAGAGIGIGEFNDRKVEFVDQLAFGGSQDTSFVGGFGAGFDWFVRDNIAINFEAKQTYGFETDVTIQGDKRKLDLDATLISAGLRIFYDKPGTKMSNGEPVPAARDRDGRRFYMTFRTGRAFQLAPRSNPDLTITTPTRVDFGAGAGMSFNRHWGAEIQWDYWEPDLEAPGFDEVSEYALWSIVAQLRWRYPIHNDRVVPYLVAGGGIGWVNVNDPKVPFEDFPMPTRTLTTPVGSFGGGVEYFLMSNIALGLEGKFIVPFEVNDIRVGDRKLTLDNSAFLLNASLRVLFP